MRTLSLNGVSHAVPFADLFRPLTDREREELTESITLDGVLHGIHVYTSPTHGPAIIDGLHRGTIAESLGWQSVPVIDHGELDDIDARRIAESLNTARRHLTPEEIAARAAERRQRVAAARAAGKSTRAIAAAEGVSQGQVCRDLEAAGESPDSPEPGKVVGLDGNTYPATAGDTPERMLDRTRRSLDRVIEGAVSLADGDYAARLIQFAKMHSVPLQIEGGVCVWPALNAVRAALADTAAAGYGG